MWKRVVGWLLSVIGSILVICTILGACYAQVHWGWVVGVYGLPALLFLSIGVALLASRGGPIAKSAKWFAAIYGGLLLAVVIFALAMPHQFAYAAGMMFGSVQQINQQGGVPSGLPKATSADRFAKAKEYLEKGDLAKAIPELDAYIKSFPDEALRGMATAGACMVSLIAKQYEVAWEYACVANAMTVNAAIDTQTLNVLRAVLPKVTGIPSDGEGHNAFWYVDRYWDPASLADTAKQRSYLDKALRVAPNDRVRAAVLYMRAGIPSSDAKTTGKAKQDFDEACRLDSVFDCPNSTLRTQIEGKSAPTK